MPCIKDDSTVEAIARAFCSNGRVRCRALQEVGYSVKYSEHAGLKLLDNVRVKAAIACIDKETAEKYEHNRDIAVKLLTENLTFLTTRVSNGDVGAISARTAIIRELNAISNLHSTTIHTSDDKPRELNPDKAALYREMAKAALTDRFQGPKLAKEA